MGASNALLAVVLLSLVSSIAIAHGDGVGEETVTPVAQAKLPDEASNMATAVRVEFAPGASSIPHKHPGSVFVVVVSGTVESALDDGNVKLYKSGDAWYELPGQEHRVTRNPSKSVKAVLVAWVLSDGKAPLVQPLPQQK